MKEAAFVAKNEENWKALEAFNTRLRSKGGTKRLATEEVREFARLFRLAGFNLAYAKTHFPSGSSVVYLNGLVGVSHNFFYVREKGSLGEIKEYFSHTLPRTVRETYKYWLFAVAVFILGSLFAAFYVGGDTSRVSEILPAQFTDGLTQGEIGEGIELWDGAYMSAFFATNNTRVAFNAFAWGFLAGLGSIFILFYNGLILGALFGFLHLEGADMLLAYSLVLPHGIIELAAIFLAGGGGLMIGKGILVPNEYSRKHSLILHTKKAALLIPCIVIMLVIAALIEGFFTPLPVSPWFKIGFALLTGAGLVAYFMKGAFDNAENG
jgi:uncharacterized membrane protein SpoIIM required for sporulation